MNLSQNYVRSDSLVLCITVLIRLVAVAICAVVVAGCGGGDGSPPATAVSPASSPTSDSSGAAAAAPPVRISAPPRRVGPYRFVRQPLVVVETDGDIPHAYVRLNRSLPGSSINRVKARVTVDRYAGGARTTAFSAVPRCYEQIADQVPLGRRVRVGDQVRVVLRFPGRSRSTVAVTATVSGALPSLPTDDGYQTPYLRRLGCANP